MIPRFCWLLALVAGLIAGPASAQQLLSTGVTTAVTGSVGTTYAFRGGLPDHLALQAVFTYGSGGTTATAYVQTTLDGTNWVDIASFAFTTATATKIANLTSLTPVTTLYAPTDGTLSSNTVKDGVIGSRLRVKYTTTGTYGGGTTLVVNAVAPYRASP